MSGQTLLAAPAAEILEVRLNGRAFRVTSEVRPDFWRAMANGRWEVETLRIFDEFLDGETVFFDIGAWMGPTTLYAAPAAARVICFEPDPVAFAELSRNIGLNQNELWAERIQAVNSAVGVDAGTMRIGSREGLGESVSSALYADEANSVEVDVVAFDSLADDPRLDGRKVFVKIDVEGSEYDLLRHPSRLLARPESVLCLSLHPRILRRRERAASGHSPLAMIRRRLGFVKRHREIFAALPYQHYYAANGKPLHLGWQLCRAFFLGKFEREIVCTHQPWDGNQAAPS